MKRPRGRPRKVRTPPCVHYWKIDGYNVGTCKLCGEVKDFGALPQLRGQGSIARYYKEVK